MATRKLLPNTLTLRRLVEAGWDANLCERSIGRLKFDLFGFADVIAFKGNTLLLVQATDFSHSSDRTTKVLKNETALLWLQGLGRHIEVWAWKYDKEIKPVLKITKVSLGSQGWLVKEKAAVQQQLG